MFPDVPIRTLITGSYVSSCPKSEYLQVEAMKFTMMRSSFFDPYEWL